MAETMESHALAAGRTFPWHECYVPDTEAAIRFYTEALDFGTESTEMGEMGKYHMLTRNGTPIAGLMSTNAPEMEGVPAHWSVYLSVDDVDARIAKCVALGAKVVVPAMDVPSVGRMALISDPQGAHIWLYTSSN